MEIKYFVAQAFRYTESGNWDYKLVGMYDTLTEAKQAFHSRMSAIIKSTNDIAMVIIYDSFGNKILSDFDTTYVEPTPEDKDSGESEIIDETTTA